MLILTIKFNAIHKRVCDVLPPSPLLTCGNVGGNGYNNDGDGGSGNNNDKDNYWRDGRSDHSWCLV